MAVQVKHPQIFGYEIIFPKSNFSESSLIRYTWEALDHIDIVVTIIAAFYYLVAVTGTVLLLDIDYLDAMTVSQ